MGKGDDPAWAKITTQRRLLHGDESTSKAADELTWTLPGDRQQEDAERIRLFRVLVVICGPVFIKLFSEFIILRLIII